MQFDALSAVHITSTLAIIGTILYALSDVFLLGYEVGPRESVPETAEADLSPYALRPSMAVGYAQTASLPAARLTWGGLLGVLATPLLFSGLLPVYYALRPAGFWLAFLPSLFFACAWILSPFVHGSFIYIEQNAQALVRLPIEARPVLGSMFLLQQRVLFTAYAVIGVAAVLGSFLFSIVVATRETSLPRWMSAVNPITMILAWVILKRFLPKQVARYTEGAGFNIGFLLFFIFLAVHLW